ncbi:MAG: glucose-1-phosphate thymidylyltransferase [Candidatus Cloacimonetes bacterium]|nr:glucose-1-phosphate thymidylyltransferase [Candidatus Cloacimonadota bacterium]
MQLNTSCFLDLTDFLWADLFQGDPVIYTVLGKTLSEFCSRFHGREIHGTVMEGAYLEGDGIYIGKGSIVEPTAYIKGPCIIGENTEIRHGAYLRGNVVAGNHCVIGHATEVKNSIFLNGAKAGHFAYVGDSILGNDVNLGAGTKLANLKLVPGGIVLNLNGERIDTGLRKMGAVLGSLVEIGCNAVTSPGTILAPQSMVFPAIGIKGVFLQKTVLRESNMNLRKS